MNRRQFAMCVGGAVAALLPQTAQSTPTSCSQPTDKYIKPTQGLEPLYQKKYVRRVKRDEIENIRVDKSLNMNFEQEVYQQPWEELSTEQDSFIMPGRDEVEIHHPVTFDTEYTKQHWKVIEILEPSEPHTFSDNISIQPFFP